MKLTIPPRAAAIALGALTLLPIALVATATSDEGDGPRRDRTLFELPAPAVADTGLDRIISVTAGRAPFRVARAPSGVAYDPLRSDPGLQVPVAAVFHPALLVSGIVNGRRAGAVVEGIPGHEGGALLFEGDSLGGVRLRRVIGDRVVLSGFDTTWTLAVRRPW